MIYSHEVQHMCVVKKGANHQCAPIPEEGKWVRATQISDISGLTHGIGWCAPKQGGCKLTLNVKEGIIEEAGKDHLIIRDNTNNLWYLIRILYLNYVEFMEPIIYSHAYSEKTY